MEPRVDFLAINDLMNVKPLISHSVSPKKNKITTISSSSSNSLLSSEEGHHLSPIKRVSGVKRRKNIMNPVQMMEGVMSSSKQNVKRTESNLNEIFGGYAFKGYLMAKEKKQHKHILNKSVNIHREKYMTYVNKLEQLAVKQKYLQQFSPQQVQRNGSPVLHSASQVGFS